MQPLRDGLPKEQPQATAKRYIPAFMHIDAICKVRIPGILSSGNAAMVYRA